MQLHRGRLIDHVHLMSRDLDAAKAFYRAILDVLDVPFVEEKDHAWADELWIAAGEPLSHIHLAFQARDEETVKRFYDAGLAAGGKDNGEPGERKKYHPGYYAAFLYDPDGNNIEAVYHGPYKRSAPSVTLDF